ncbi:MAG: uncharacterized protein KVP18_004926 [Porospora cf. gigantea A]|uniref:uncharacterized protein n=1 Tax=Porospora cf. gigantea A TaxID=2853593 RepID=UPI00355A53EA|nr:MAG: hypothetical protein KVP18_004926 [Porospora cf. gigantea A]
MHPGFAGPAPSHILSQIPWLGADASAIDGMTPEIKDEMYRQMGAAIADERKPRKTQGPPGLLSTNRTLYVNNLNEKVQLDQLKLDICELFGSFGEVISVTAMNSFWRRGQAFVLMDSLESASKALEGLQGFEYQGKCMRVNYAREKAHKETGAAPSQRTAPLKPRGVIAREEALRERLRNIQMCAASGKTEELKAEEAAPAVSVADFFHDRLGVNQNKKLPENATDTLHIADVPPEVPESKIRMLFRQFPGFDETQFSMAEGRAEAVYASSAAAATAYNALRNFEVTRGHWLAVSFKPACLS